jgi:hypothetical protein
VEVSILDRDRGGSELIARVVLPLNRALGGINEWLPLDGGGQILLHTRQRTHSLRDERLSKCDRALHKHFPVSETEHVTHDFRCALIKKRGVVHAGRLWLTPQHLFFYSRTTKVSVAWKDVENVAKGSSVANSIILRTKTQRTLKFCYFRTRTECLLAIDNYLTQAQLVSCGGLSSSTSSSIAITNTTTTTTTTTTNPTTMTNVLNYFSSHITANTTLPLPPCLSLLIVSALRV